MRRGRRFGAILGRGLAVVVAICVISGVTATVMDMGPAGADPYSDAQTDIGYAGSTFATGAFWLESLGPEAGPAGLGLSLLAGILGPLFGIGSTGPTIQDVMNKLDKISDQLNQIQSQLNQISANIAALQQQVAAVSKQVADASCAGLQKPLSGYVNTIDGINSEYASTLTTAQTLPTSKDPDATVNTLKEDFTNLANDAFKNSNTPAGGDLENAITGIHNLLMGQGGQATDGVIHVCGEAGLKDYQASSQAGTPSSQQWIDDRPYYAYVTALVNYYDNYEALALNLLQEASYYRVTQLLQQDKVTIPADQKTGACSVQDPKSADPSQLCRDALKATKDVYQHFVDEWTLTGRPYSDGKVVLQVDAAASGAGRAKPILWLRDPTAASPCETTGTWDADPNTTCQFDGFAGWKPANLANWQSLQDTAITAWGFGRNSCTSDNGLLHEESIFNCMAYVGGFRNVSGIFWIPQQKATGLTLAAPDPGVFSVHGNVGHTFPYEYGGPDVTLRCFVTAVPQTETSGGPIACNQRWLDAHFPITKTLEEYPLSQYATYTVQWGLSSTPGISLGATTLGYYYVDPLDSLATGYSFDDTTNSYPLRINTPVVGPYPFFLGPLDYQALRSCNGGYDMCVDRQESYQPASTKEQLWQTLAVPTANTSTQRCLNSDGVPQLCAPVGTTKPTAADQQFENWLNNAIPNPSEPFPEATARPSIKSSGGDAQCLPGAWKAPPSDWTYGKVRPLAISWTATNGTTTYTTPVNAATPVRLDNKLDLKGFVQSAKFEAKVPFQITCTARARWEHLANAGSSTSANYQVTPVGSSFHTTFIITRIPDAPTIGSATAGVRSATLHWTVGGSKGGQLTSFTVIPYMDGVAQSPLTVPAIGGDVSPNEGAHDSMVIRDLKPGKKYTFRVKANVNTPETSTNSPPSSASEAVIPKAGPPLSPLSPTTTTVPLRPVSTTTTTVPLSPISPTTTTVPLSPVSPTTIPSGGGGYTQSMTEQSAKTALATFMPQSPVKLVDLHYVVDGGQQQDFRMVLQPDGRYEEPVVNLSSGNKMLYWFYYEPVSKGAVPITTQTFEYTQP